MPHIHTKDNEHDFTVTAYIVRLDTVEPKVLLHMHKKLHVLLPVGGHVELLETPWQAIAHEIAEESGYEIDQLKILQSKSRIKQISRTVRTVQHPIPLSINTHSLPDKHFHTDIEYAFITKEDPMLPVGDDESKDIRWLSRSELNNLHSAAIFEDTKETYNFILNEALGEWDTIPTDTYTLGFPKEYPN